MIKSITLSNFFSFLDQEIVFHNNVNILVGINGSGKSNLLKAIKLLRVGVIGNQDDNALQDLIINIWGGFDNIKYKGSGIKEYRNSIGLEFKFDKDILSKYGPFTFKSDLVYKIVIIKKPNVENYYISETIDTETGYYYLDFINGTGKVSERFEAEGVRNVTYDNYNPRELALSKISEFDSDRFLPLTIVKKAIKDIAVYEYLNTTPSSKLRGSMSATSTEKKLLPDGSNLPQLLNLININYKAQLKEIQAMIKDVNSKFTGFSFNIMGSGFLELMLDEDNLESSIHVTHISDGTLRFLCILAIIFNPNRGRVVCIDEPEVGLHPDMIYNICKSIEKATNETTFIIATHNENILSAFRLENIRVFEKDENNSTIVNQLNEEDFKDWYDDFNPGQMWRDGDLGGKRW